MKRQPKALKQRTSSRSRPLLLGPLKVTSEWFEEPQVVFNRGYVHEDPKVGIPLYGPCSLGTSRHKREVHVGFIGTGEGTAKAISFYQQCCEGIAGDLAHSPFPGCRLDRGYRSDLKIDSQLVEPITRNELDDLLKIRGQKERFEITVGLLQNKLRILCGRDHPLDYIVLVVPTDMFAKCRVADYYEKGVGDVHRDLRRAFKACAMEFKKPNPIVIGSDSR